MHYDDDNDDDDDDDDDGSLPEGRFIGSYAPPRGLDDRCFLVAFLIHNYG